MEVDAREGDYLVERAEQENEKDQTWSPKEENASKIGEYL